MKTTTRRRGRPPKQVTGAAEDQGWKSNDEPEKGGNHRQQYIEGTEPIRIKEIDTAAEDYRDIRDRRKELTIEECKANELLLGLMKKHNLTSYRFDGSEVTIAKEKEKACVRRIQVEQDGDEE